MKTYIKATAAWLIFLWATGQADAQQPDSVRVVYDKDGNMYRNVYYSTSKKGNSVDIGYGSKKKKKKSPRIVPYPAGKQLITVTYGGALSATQLNAGTYPLQAMINAGSYTVNNTPGINTKYFVEKDKPKFSILKYLPYAAMAVTILLAIFFFRRNRDEEITLPT